MLYLDIDSKRIGRLLRRERKRLGLSLDEFGDRIGCRDVRILELIEEGTPPEGCNLVAKLGRSKYSFNITIDVPSGAPKRAEVNLFTFRKQELRDQILRIIISRQISVTDEELRDVFWQLETEYDLSMEERSGAVLAFRHRDAFLKLNEDVVRDMVRKARERRSN